MKLKAYIAVGIICIVWGTTYLAIRVGTMEFPPFLFSGVRFIIAGLLICGFYLLKGAKWPDRKDFFHLLVSGLFLCMGGNLLLVIAERHVPSGMAALVNCAFPFWIVIISLVINKADKISMFAFAGLAIGFSAAWYTSVAIVKKQIPGGMSV